MKTLPLPIVKEAVLVGGGHTHALVLRRWGMNPVPGARLTVINPVPTAPYTGMLPGFVAGHYRRAALEIDLVRLARAAGARIIFGRVEGIDRSAQRLAVAGRPPVPYDIASLDIGITSDMPDLPGFAEHGIAAKPLGAFALRWTAFLAGARGPVAVIGAGVAGVELALAMRHALGQGHKVTLIEAGTALTGVAGTTRARLRAALARAGIDLHEAACVTAIGPGEVVMADGTTIASALTVGAAGARPFDWLRDTGLVLTEGFVTVDATLRSVGDEAIYAVGDCAHLGHAPRPKAGVFAVRAAPVLDANIRAELTGGTRRRFRPQAHYLKLIALGPKRALADKWGLAAEGDWVWHWKDRIDRAFMDRLNRPPAMAAPALPPGSATGVAEARGPKPLCGGCGAKLGPGTLDAVLAGLPGRPRDDVVAAAGDDAAILVSGAARQVISTDHLRAFWEDPWLMARIAAVHALGDVWAMGARPQAALAQVTLPPLGARLQGEWLAEIMAAADGVFAAEGAAIVGGHSTQGAEMTLGFTVTGLAGRPLTLAGARAGDALILTRPVGSGTLLAAEMAGLAEGDAVAAALGIMATPQGDAARVLAGSARAMTDVTGFGLGGHVARMAQASGLTAHLDLGALPLFAGAEALAGAGIRSSIWEANRAAVAAAVPDTARGALVFDPQTAGGLLAAVPPGASGATLAAIRDQGHGAAIVGEMVPMEGTALTAR